MNTKKTETQPSPEADSGRTASTCSIFRPPFTYTACGGIYMQNTKCGDAKMLDVRGWGYLTGQCALAMDENEACKVQDEFGELVAKLLNEHFSSNVKHTSRDYNQQKTMNEENTDKQPNHQATQGRTASTCSVRCSLCEGIGWLDGFAGLGRTECHNCDGSGVEIITQRRVQSREERALICDVLFCPELLITMKG